jgi:hypothetical protein
MAMGKQNQIQRTRAPLLQEGQHKRSRLGLATVDKQAFVRCRRNQNGIAVPDRNHVYLRSGTRRRRPRLAHAAEAKQSREQNPGTRRHVWFRHRSRLDTKSQGRKKTATTCSPIGKEPRKLREPELMALADLSRFECPKALLPK